VNRAYFQRPDDCIHKGYDRQAESDLSSPNTFLSNFEPLTRDQVHEIKDDSIGFDLVYTAGKRLDQQLSGRAIPRSIW
jgi:hypothetical protein